MGLPDHDRRAVLRRLGAPLALALARRIGPGLAAGVALPGRAGEPLAADVWDEFQRRFVTSDGRVVDDDGATHSEGLGTALLACASVGDREAFERIRAVANRLRRDDGLFSWRVQAGGRVIDANNATDGDVYIAWALALAAGAFNDAGCASDARAIARALRAHCVRDSRFGPVLVPGRVGFDRPRLVVANPSYWVFPAFEVLGTVDPHPQWRAIEQTALALLDRARFGARGLTADWIEIEGAAVRPWRERPARFGYEAIRVPLFLYWDGRFDAALLAAFARHAAAPNFPAWVALDSDEVARERAPAGFEAIARLARALPALSPARLPALGASYYSSSLVLLSALANDAVLRHAPMPQNATRAGEAGTPKRTATN